MNDMNEMLEFQQIKEMLKAYAMTEKARERLEALKPYLNQTRAEAAVRETTEGRLVPVSYTHLDVYKRQAAAFWVFVFSYIWKNLGYTVVLWLTGILSISEEVREAARKPSAYFFTSATVA